MDMDISMDIHGKSVDMDMDMDGKYHIHGKPAVVRCHVFTLTYISLLSNDNLMTGLRDVGYNHAKRLN